MLREAAPVTFRHDQLAESDKEFDGRPFTVKRSTRRIIAEQWSKKKS